MKALIKLTRPKHCLKNGLVFLPALFAGTFLHKEIFIAGFFGFLVFSFTASAVYIINDIQDVEQDRKHEKKRLRPLASGELSVRTAVLSAIMLLAFAFAFDLFTNNKQYTWIYLLIYIFINLAYSFGMKNIPLVDLVILTFGFVLRIMYGSAVTSTPVSNWMYLVIIAASFYMSLGKRRNEVDAGVRHVLKHYPHSFLDKNMYVCFTLTVVFYCIWCLENADLSALLIWTVPLVLLILMRYSMIVESQTSGDPVDVLTSDKPLFSLVSVYFIMMFLLLYGELIKTNL